MTKKYDVIEEITVRPDPSVDSEKFNPYHDARGRFATANSYASFTTRTKDPKKQHWADMAVARQKEKTPEAGKPEPKKPAGYGNTDQQTKHHTKSYRKTMTASEMADQVAKELDVTKHEAAMMTTSVIKYSGNAYDEIRAASRGEKNGYQADAKQCEDFIKASPKWAGGKLYRGIKDLPDEVYNKILSHAWKGKEIDMHGVSSWSSKKSVAEQFAAKPASYVKNKIVFVTNGTSTKKGASIKHLSQYEMEDEVLMSVTASFKPTKVTNHGGVVYIHGDMD